MKISARNQLVCEVVSIVEGAVMAEVVVQLDGGQLVVSAITAESARRLDLEQLPQTRADGRFGTGVR